MNATRAQIASASSADAAEVIAACQSDLTLGLTVADAACAWSLTARTSARNAPVLIFSAHSTRAGLPARGSLAPTVAGTPGQDMTKR